jgi:hypothetical protein
MILWCSVFTWFFQFNCNPKPKNNEGEVPKNIAKDKDNKDAMKECRKAEKSFGKVGKNNEPWAIQLYDWVNEITKYFYTSDIITFIV